MNSHVKIQKLVPDIGSNSDGLERRVYVCVCVCVRMCVCMYVCMHVCLYVCMYVGVTHL